MSGAPQYSYQRAVIELARELHRDRGMEEWHRLTEPTRKRWYERARSLIRRCPTIAEALKG